MILDRQCRVEAAPREAERRYWESLPPEARRLASAAGQPARRDLHVDRA